MILVIVTFKKLINLFQLEANYLRSKRVSKTPGSLELEMSVWINDLFSIFNEIYIF